MFARIWPATAGVFGITADFQPPPNSALAAALGFAISASVAIRTAMEIPKSGDIMSALGAGRHAIVAALHPLSVLWR